MNPRAAHWVVALAAALVVHLAVAALFARNDDVGGPAGGAALPRIAVAPLEFRDPETPRAESRAARESRPTPVERMPAPTPVAPRPHPTSPARAPRPLPTEPGPPPTPSVAKPREVETPVETVATIEPGPVAARTAPLERTESLPRSARAASPAQGAETAAVRPPRDAGRAYRSYHDALAGWLDRHKRYPRRARQKGQQGRVTVAFTIDAQGEMLDYGIVESSGFALLDAEALRMLERAAPMPAIPLALNVERLPVTVPVSFTLH